MHVCVSELANPSCHLLELNIFIISSPTFIFTNLIPNLLKKNREMKNLTFCLPWEMTSEWHLKQMFVYAWLNACMDVY